jgi:hypothetical protein
VTKSKTRKAHGKYIIWKRIYVGILGRREGKA